MPKSAGLQLAVFSAAKTVILHRGPGPPLFGGQQLREWKVQNCVLCVLSAAFKSCAASVCDPTCQIRECFKVPKSTDRCWTPVYREQVKKRLILCPCPVAVAFAFVSFNLITYNIIKNYKSPETKYEKNAASVSLSKQQVHA